MARIGIFNGLQRRLLLLLLLPFFVLASLNAWFDFREADAVSLQQDRQLLSLVPLLADSIVPVGDAVRPNLVLLTAPPVEDFLNRREGQSAMAVIDTDGVVLAGAEWLDGSLPVTRDPTFTSEEFAGVTYRIVSQRVQTGVGELVVRLADGSDARQQWLRLLAYRVFLPNFILAVGGIFAIRWAVGTALKPLLELRDAVESRSPRDLSALDPDASPDEVRPLVLSLNRLFALVTAQAESQSRFVTDAAHQLRTPLAALQAQVEAWAQTAESTAGQQKSPQGQTEKPQTSITLGAAQVLSLRSAVRRTSQLANQLLALSRVDSRSVLLQPLQRIDLQQLCESVLESYLGAAHEKQIDLGLEVSPALIHGHEGLLRELLVNLVDNALKYTPCGGHVTIRCWQHWHAYLEAEDDGPGIAEAERGRVLERFYRVPGSPSEGSGLGLAIADEIAQSHHGKLELVTGSSGRGLRVRLSLGLYQWDARI